MNIWTETTEEPTTPRRRRTCAVGRGSVVLREAAPVTGFVLDGNWGTFLDWNVCFTTETRAQRIAEMAAGHLRELEAEIAAMDALPENASDKTAAG